jgi:phosphoribosylformylglycinamidine synthase
MAALPGWLAHGGVVLGICNGFQILTEMGLLPGALAVNRGQRFVCKTVAVTVPAGTCWGDDWPAGALLQVPVAHRQGRYVADAQTIARLERQGQVMLRYAHDINGSAGQIAGLCSADGQVLGLMPHPERAWAPWHQSYDGRRLLAAVVRRAGLAGDGQDAGGQSTSRAESMATESAGR